MKTFQLSVLTLVIAAGAAAAERPAFEQLRERSGSREVALADFRGGRGDRGDRGDRGGRREEPGREAGMRACMKSFSDYQKNECMKAVNAAAYLDPIAAEACGDISSDYQKVECMKAIPDKRYAASEVDLCKSNFSDYQKVECFKTGGRPYAREDRPRYERRPDLDSYILRRLRGIKSQLEMGRIPAALLDMVDLIAFVEDGMSGRSH